MSQCLSARVAGLAAGFCLIWLVALASPGRAAAGDNNGENIGPFNLTYGNQGDNPLKGHVDPGYDNYHDYDATRSFTPSEKSQTDLSLRYWAERLAKNTGNGPAGIYFVFHHNPDGSATSTSTSTIPPYDEARWGVSPNGTVYDNLVLGRASPWPRGLADNIITFEIDYDPTPPRLLFNDNSIMSTVIHEMGHALGIITNMEPTNKDGSRGKYNQITAWDSHVRDVFGKPAKTGMLIANNANSGNQANVFQFFGSDTAPANYRYPVFRGEHVDALTGGAGMPVMGGSTWTDSGAGIDGGNSLGHPGLMQSIMSYGIVRNMPFSELELAMFQDLGYEMDRSDFFGKSYYYRVGGDSQTNTLGFGSAANPNSAILGLGLHVMRNNLNLTQAADIHAGGYAGGGIRIDGVGNTLAVPAGVTVAADSQNGTGLLVSYGSDNRVDLNGTLRAREAGGIAAHFGIIAADYRVASYMPNYSGITTFVDSEGVTKAVPIQERHELLTASRDLGGPLVRDFNVGGTLQGRQAAIQIERDSHVAALNFRDGSAVSGNVTSAWARNSQGGTNYSTTLTFGNADGNGNMRLDGNIVWKSDNTYVKNQGAAVNSLDVEQDGGTLTYNGNANVYKWRVGDNATLKGKNNIRIEGPGQALVCAGSISPGDDDGIGSIAIDGDFILEAGGALDMQFDADRFDSLIITGNADIRGGLNLAPLADFYANNTVLEVTPQMLFGGNNDLNSMSVFTSVNASALSSPTLTTGDDVNAQNASFSIGRNPDSYRQYASGDNSAALGSALFRLADHADDRLADLYVALDFSAPDGSEVRDALPELLPGAYANLAAASWDDARALAGTVFGQLWSATATGVCVASGDAESGTDPCRPASPAGNGRFFLTPNAGTSRQRTRDDSLGYDSTRAGAVGGMNWLVPNGAFGFHAAYAHRWTDTDSAATSRAETDALSIGLQGLWQPGNGVCLTALANAGAELSRMDRSVRIGSFAQRYDENFAAYTLLGAFRGGYEWESGCWRFGPAAGLDYNGYFRSDIEEKGGAGALEIHREAAQSLTLAAGLQVRSEMYSGGGNTLKTRFGAEWRHELLPGHNRYRANFAGFPDAGFSGTVRWGGRDSLAVRAGASLAVRDRYEIGAYAGGEFFRAGYQALEGGVTFGCGF